VLVVSHDRYFIQKVAERVVFITDRRFVEYEGDFDEYWRDVGSRSGIGVRGESRSGPSGIEQRGRKASGTGGSGAKSEFEARIDDMEREKERLERASAAAFDARDYKKAKALASELERHNARLQKVWAEFIL